MNNNDTDRRGNFPAQFVTCLAAMVTALGVFLYVNDEGPLTMILGLIGVTAGLVATVRGRR